MGAAIIAFTRVLATLATGYWLNDFAAWVNNTFGLGTKTLNAKGNGFAWWYVAIILVVLTGIVAAVVYVAGMVFPVRGRRRKRR